MPYSLLLAARLKSAGWKVKIHDNEWNEEPHVTIRRRLDAWRFSLRTGLFLDSRPPSREVPAELIQQIREHLQELQDAWDLLYPENPISSAGGNDE